MNRWAGCRWIGALPVVVVLLGSVVGGSTQTPVHFHDSTLRAAVRTELGIPFTEDITVGHMKLLHYLRVTNRTIGELQGLEYAVNLHYLNLGSNEISDLEPLSGLTNLTELQLWGNEISDLGPLAGLAKLDELHLADNEISDLSPLVGLTGLKELVLAQNPISDLSPLAGLTNLTMLSLHENEISELAPLAGLAGLTELYLSENEISELGPLAGLTNLTELWLWDNEISDLGPLAGLTNLTVLFLSANEVSDLGPLAGLTNLTWLFLDHNQISDISPLVENSDAGGLGTGDRVVLRENYLDLTEGSQAMTDIQTLIDRGVDVSYIPQLEDDRLEVTLSYSPEEPTTEDTMLFTTEVTAPDELGEATLTYAWFLNDEPTGESGPSFTWDNPPEGEHTVQVVVADGEGREAEDSVTFTVEEALAVELSYSPEEPTTEDTMLFTTEVTAPSGVSLSYSWFLNGALLPDVASHGATWDEPSAGTHTVRVVVSDDEGRQAEDSVTFTVEEIVLDEITIGLLTIRADRIVKTGDETWTASGNVSINEFLRTNAVLHLDMEKLEVSGSGRVYIPSVPVVGTVNLFEGSFELEADLAQLADAYGVATKFEVGGLSFELKKLKVIASGVEVEGELELPPWAYGLKVSAGVTITTHSGIELDEGKIEIPKINLGGGYGITDAYLEYKTENALPIWGGGGGVSVPNLFTLEGSLELRDGSISKVSIGLDDLNVVIGTLPVFLQKIHASLEGVDPHADNVELTGTLGFTGGPRVAGKHAIGAELSASIDGTGKLEGTGKITLISDEGEIAGGSVALDPGRYVAGVGLRDASLSISGTLDILGILVAEGSAAIGTENNLRGRFTGSLQTPDDWRLIGGRQFSGLDAWLSNDQFAMSVSVWRFGVIVAYAPEGRESWATWGNWHIGCNLEEIEQEHAMPLALGAVETSFAIPPDTSFGVFQLTWEQGDADFYIIDPDGAEITEAVAEANPDDYLFERHAGDRLAFFAVNGPQPGSWQIVVSNAEDIGAFAPKVLGGVEEDPSVDYEPPTVPTIEPYETTAAPGWTFFGLPVEPQDWDPDSLAITPEPAFSYLYRWDPGTRCYLAAHRDEITELEELHGYWLYLSREHTAYEVCVEGTALTGDQGVELGPVGWQMIGVPYPVAWGDADGGSMRFRNNTEEKTLAEAITAGWVLNTIYAWDSTEGAWIRYRATDGETLELWTGYFLYTLQDDLELIFSEKQVAWPAGFALSVAAQAFDPGEPPLPVLPSGLPVQGLDAVAFPNPVTDGGGVTFTVRGPAARWVEAISVRVHDLSGRIVHQDEGDGGSLLWDTMGVTGVPVASGVYLYTVQAKLEGEWVSAAVEKLLILR